MSLLFGLSVVAAPVSPVEAFRAVSGRVVLVLAVSRRVMLCRAVSCWFGLFFV